MSGQAQVDSKWLVEGTEGSSSWTLWLMPIILATWEVEIRRITVPGQHGQNKVHETSISTEKCWAWWHMLVIPAMPRSMK
jgi:hypothetical protein